MKKVTQIKELQKSLNQVRRKKKPIRFVPTMGFLHEGHVQLIRAAKKEGGFVVVSIFVNPLQFGPHEDYQRYPRNLNRDIQILKKEKVDLLFSPSTTSVHVSLFCSP